MPGPDMGQSDQDLDDNDLMSMALRSPGQDSEGAPNFQPGWARGGQGHTTGAGAMLGNEAKMNGSIRSMWENMYGGGIAKQMGMGNGKKPSQDQGSGSSGGSGGSSSGSNPLSSLGGGSSGGGGGNPLSGILGGGDSGGGAGDAMGDMGGMMMAAHGANFVTQGPQPMLVGEAGPEHVQVTPMGGRPKPHMAPARPARPAMPFGMAGGTLRGR
jgi:hypothetical protein